MLQNKLFILFLLILIISFSFAVSAQEDELMQEIYAYYPLDGNTVDQGPNKLHGEQINKKSRTEDRFGNKGKALYFTEQNDSITLPVNINPDKMPQLTMAFWLKVKSVNKIDNIISNNSRGFSRSIVINKRNNHKFLSIIAGNNQEIYGGLNIPENRWFFTAVSWNAENGKVSIYLIDQNNNFRLISTNNIKPEKGKDYITLGQNFAVTDVFRKSIDQLMIWDRILTADEIKRLVY